ncbi:Copia protein [Termitomyces sp. J132]|nr:Copia protein [Termitomyces sp. J132]
MHHILMGKAHAMRVTARCPPCLWDEFYLTAAHLHGKTKTSAVQDATPDKLWYGKKPNYSYICRISCQVFVFIQNKHNPKIYKQSIECVLIGYNQNSKAYRCYDYAAKKVGSLYHMQFIESHKDSPDSRAANNKSSAEDKEDSQTINSTAENATDQPISIPYMKMTMYQTCQGLFATNQCKPRLRSNTNQQTNNYQMHKYNDPLNEHFKHEMAIMWTIVDLGTPKHILGIAVEWKRDINQVCLSQSVLIDQLVQQFGKMDATPMLTLMEPGTKLRWVDLKELSQDKCKKIAQIPYQCLVRGLLWLAVSTHPNIQYAVQQLSQFRDCYTQMHWHAAVRTLHYLKGTCTFGLTLGSKDLVKLVGFMDSGWANCPDTRWSVGRYTFSTQKQCTVAASSCGAEYMAAFEAAQECIWLCMLLAAIGHTLAGATTLLCDNNSAMDLLEDPMLHQCIKHIDIKYHFLQECVASGYVNTKRNIADIFTKTLPAPQFLNLCLTLGLSLDPAHGGVSNSW